MMFHPQVCACIHHLHVPSLLPRLLGLFESSFSWLGSLQYSTCTSLLGRAGSSLFSSLIPQVLSFRSQACTFPLHNFFFFFFFSPLPLWTVLPLFSCHTLCWLCQTSVCMFWSQWCLEGDAGLTLPAPSMSRGWGRAELIDWCLITEGSSHSLPTLPPGCWWGRAQLGEHEAWLAAGSWACCAACPQSLLLPLGVASPIPCCRVAKTFVFLVHGELGWLIS